MNINPYENFVVSTDHRGVVTVAINVGGRPLNVLTRVAMLELETIVGELERSFGVTGVIFRSDKESGFLAGADVSVIAGIETKVEGFGLIEAGQQLFARIEQLPMPTILLIDGPCLGGGLEWALACDHRIARDNSSTKIGLPEIQLGLIPGWGGTQRLPRVVGLAAAMPMILTGKHLSAKEAARIGLVDLAIKPDDWQREVNRFVDEVVDGRSESRHSLSWKSRLLDHTTLGRCITIAMARRSVRSKSTHHPALSAAIDAMAAGFDKRRDGFKVERDRFVEMLGTATSKNLLNLFFARERARKTSTWISNAHKAMHSSPIRRVGVVGAGVMGAGIGQLAAVRGYSVVIKEVDDESCRAGTSRIDGLVREYANRKQFSAIDRDRLRSKIVVTTDASMMGDCDLVIEAIVERIDVKERVFSELDHHLKSSAILTSNTSSLSVTRMGMATKRSQQVAGLHFFNPVHRMELVEVVRCHDTDDATMARLVAFVKTLGKTPVVTTDTPGFLVNRVLFPYLGEAILMVAEGGDVEAIDREVRRFGMPMGPLELLDQVGIDVAAHVAKSLDGVLPDVASVVNHLDSMVSRGLLGRKSGQGFYRYRGGKRGGGMLSSTRNAVTTAPSFAGMIDDGLSPITRRLIYPMLLEATRCHQERVVNEPWAIDLAMVLGTGFAPHRGGPLQMIESIGKKTVLENAERLEMTLGDRFTTNDIVAFRTKQPLPSIELGHQESP
ncbi:Fatty acid oxidation complex subunit alpha [Rubripirellula tenax]|uniref:enoyl-CoA hydratase n=1 Tax=Rubripirellula tenax TaxID=2528015 RepID=A0A5C6ECA8_9BACT|nr:3-hydroxyacyl-CoA dehydrogenase NAD-binding domain-containing protein [Rubripirellula tenax]TWU47423.1 Fatty acid oxidation complex subunit alpha [Rubripirellula tenax]